MASISLPPQPQTASAFSHYLDTAPPSPRGHRRNMTMSTPLPNPHFVFPARDPGDSPPAPEPKNRSAAPLPAFSFNPGAGHSSQPSMPTLPVNRPGGHRRRCSEFIGNDRLVTPGTAEPAPDRDEPPVPAPVNLPAPGPGFSAGAPGRKRHAHRRSAAISSVDLTAISNALDTKPTASTPGTPADAKDQQQVDKPARPISHPASSPSRPTPPASPRITINGESLQPAPPDSPASLIFVDNKPSPSEGSPNEFNVVPAIPSENATRNSGRTGPLSDNTPQHVEIPKPRPRTADASLMLSATTDDMSRSKRPISSAGHSRFRKSLSSGVLDAALRKHHADHNSPWGDVRHSSSDDGDSDISFDDLHGSPEAQSKKRTKAKNRQKKVRSWAGAILTRGKGKRQHSKKDPSATKSIPPPVLTRTNSDVGSALDVDFDDDNIVVIRTPTNPCAPKSHQPDDDADDEAQPTLENSWKPRSFYEQVTPSDALSPIIDLDAALGPFNTPDMGSRNVPESGFSVASRRMYSGGRRGEFIGPEMRYHRRAESAPTLPPFDRSFLKSSRLSSNLTLENPDVFYEEEEDAFLAATSEPATDGDHPTSAAAIASSTDDSGTQSVRSKESSDTLRHQAVAEDRDVQTGLGIAKDESRPPTSTHINDAKAEDPQPSQRPDTAEQLHQNNPFSGQPKAPVEAIKHEDWHRKIPIPPSPDISPRFMPVDHRPATSPLELTPNIPQFSLGGSSVSNSSFPSPDFTISSDAPRSITTSSTTDRNFSNPSYNPSMDFPHASVEDVPSLTSSASTMTNTLNRFSANIFQRPRLSTDRSASLSAAVHRRSSQPSSSKRSSLASLSKLMVGPHNERSKLSHEEKPPSDEPEKARKKGRRISRLMHFWRIKEKDRSTANVPEGRPF